MRKLSFVCIALLLFSVCETYAKVYRNTLVEMKLSGMVSSLVVNTYPTDVKYGKAEKKALRHSQYFKFDKEGMLTEMVLKQPKRDSVKFTYIYEGIRLMETVSPAYSYKFIRDEEGLVIEEQCYSGKGLLVERTEFKNDSKGNCIQKTVDNEMSCTGFTEFKHDSNGNVIEEAFTEYEDVCMTYKKYDDNNFLIQEDIFDTEKRLLHGFTYEYVFDDKGNWISQKKIEKGFPVEIVERELTYATTAPLSKDALIKKLTEYLLLLVLIWMVAHMLYVIYKGKRFKTVFTPDHFASLRAQSGISPSESENVTDRAYELLQKAFLQWTVVGAEDGAEYRKPTKMKQIKSSVAYLDQVIAMNPEDEEVIKSLNEYTDVINSAEARSFYGSKAIIVIGLLVAAFFAFTDSRSGGFVKEFFTGGFVMWGPVIVYILASRKPQFLIDKKLANSDGVKPASGVAAVIFGIIGGAHTVRTVTKWSDGTKTVEDDNTQHLFAWVIAFLIMMVIAAFMWLWAIFNYLRNYVFFF